MCTCPNQPGTVDRFSSGIGIKSSKLYNSHYIKFQKFSYEINRVFHIILGYLSVFPHIPERNQNVPRAMRAY